MNYWAKSITHAFSYLRNFIAKILFSFSFDWEYNYKFRQLGSIEKLQNLMQVFRVLNNST